MTNDATTYLKYANLQLASEALFEFNNKLATGGASPGTTRGYPDISATYLVDGNNRSSRFTPTQADQFLADGWTVAEHISNTTTGFSGTLFRNSQSNELVLSFRSTEFIDDAARDNQATNALEIKTEGWAFGQISDMQSWVNSLVDSGKIGPSDALTVTGYSLGGHLATAFNLLYPRRAAATYTFNGAGVGEVSAGSDLKQVMADFTSHRVQGSNADLFSRPDVVARYARLAADFKDGAPVTVQQVEAAMQSLAQSGLVPIDAKLLYDALDRVRSVAYEAERIGAGLSSGTDGAPALQVGTSAIAAVGLDYQLAVLRASQSTDAHRTGIVTGGYDALTSRNTAPEGFVLGFHDLFGAAPPSAVSNSQYHYGEPLPIYIEDQPLLRGNIVADAGTTTAKAGEVKLLVDRFSLNDFGDTHSLVLIVDSLSVQDMLAKLDPSISQAAISAVFSAASNKASQFTLGTQGKAEGDTLEIVVRSLADMLGIHIDPMAGKFDGGTWADPVDRAVLHANMQTIATSDAFRQIAGHAEVRAAGPGIAAAARTDFGAFAALADLSPFWISAGDGGSNEAFAAAWAAARPDDFAAWQNDRTAPAPATYTDEWIADRALLLSALMVQGRQNNSTGVVIDESVPAVRAFEFKYIGTDIPQGQVHPVGQTLVARGGPIAVPNVQRIMFGDETDNAVRGTDNRLGDHLYGASGNDALLGLGSDDFLQGDAGDDMLDGGTGNDTLVGGMGVDTYAFADAWGGDTVVDADGLGVLRIDGIALNGAGAELQGRIPLGDGDWLQVWQENVSGVGDITYRYDDATRQLDIVGAHGRIAVRNYSVGQLGLQLPVQAAPVATPEADGTLDFSQTNIYSSRSLGSHVGNDLFVHAAQATDGAPPGRLTVVDAWTGDDVVEAAASPTSRAIALRGGAGEDRMFARTRQTLDEVLADPGVQQRAAGAAPATSHLLLDGGADDDLVVGSAEDDAIFGGDGDDILVGGAGGDVILADGDSGVLQREAGDMGIGFDAETWRWVTGENDPAQFGARALALPQSLGQLTAYYASGFQDVTDIGRLQTQTLADVDFSSLAVAMPVSASQAAAEGVVAPAGSTFAFDGRAFVDLGAQAAMVEEPTRFATARHAGDDTVYAGAGDDVVNAGAGNDLVFAGADNDVVVGYDGNDVLIGEAGDDVIFGDFQAPEVPAAPAEDEAAADSASFLGVAYRNINTLDAARHGNDSIDGGDGDDTLVGNGGDDDIVGGAGNDRMYGDELQRFVAVEGDAALSGSDHLDGGDGDDLLVGGGGNDTLVAGSGADVLEGGAGDDVYFMDGADSAADAAGTNRYVIDAPDGGTVRLTDSGGGGGTVEVNDGGRSNAAPVLSIIDGKEVVQVGNLRLQGAGWLDGSLASISVNGTSYSAGWLQAHSASRRSVTVDGNDQDIDTGTGDDVVVVNGHGNRIRTRAGADSVEIHADGNQLLLEAGDGMDTLHVDPDLKDAERFLTLALGEGMDLAAVRLELRPSSSGNQIRVYTSGTRTDAVTLAMQDQDVEALLGRFVITAGDRSATLAELLDAGQVLQGGDGDDVVQAFTRPSLLQGANGNDLLLGSDFDDVLDGGEGADELHGNAGDDVYRWGSGQGSDRVVDSGGFDTLEVIDLLPSQLHPRLVNGQLQLVADTQGDVLVIESNSDRTDPIDRAVFADGTEWDVAAMRAEAQRGSSAGDSIVGSRGPDRIDGLAGDDTISGEDGDDWLSGGEGHDSLMGGAGNNTMDGGPGDDALIGLGYLSNDTYYAGDGNDTIWDSMGTNHVNFAASWSPEDIVVRAGDNLSFTQDSQNSVDIYRLFHAWSGSYRSDEFSWDFRFADGTVWTIDDVRQRALVATPGNDNIAGFETDDALTGGAGDDALSGIDGNDSLDGGKGNDWLSGGNGDDSYTWRRGEGSDVIDERTPTYYGSGNDTLHLVGFDEDDLTYTPTADGNMVITSLSTQETLTLVGQTLPDLRGTERRIENIVNDPFPSVPPSSPFTTFPPLIGSLEAMVGLERSHQILIQAMASFAAPSPPLVESNWSQAHAQAPELATDWR